MAPRPISRSISYLPMLDTKTNIGTSLRPGNAGFRGSRLLELEKPEEEAGGVDPGDVVLRVEHRTGVGVDRVDETTIEGDGDVAVQFGGDLAFVQQSEGLPGAGLRLVLEPRAAHQRDREVEAGDVEVRTEVGGVLRVDDLQTGARTRDALDVGVERVGDADVVVRRL